MDSKNSILIAQITAPHGVKGLVKLRSFAESPEDIFSYSPVTDETSARVFELKKNGIDKDGFIAAIKGVETRNDAEKLRGTNLYIARNQLPTLEKGYYHADLVGLDVLNLAKEKIGAVKAVHNFGAGDILEIEEAPKKSFMILFNEVNVPSVDLANRRIVIDRPTEV